MLVPHTHHTHHGRCWKSEGEVRRGQSGDVRQKLDGSRSCFRPTFVLSEARSTPPAWNPSARARPGDSIGLVGLGTPFQNTDSEFRQPLTIAWNDMQSGPHFRLHPDNLHVRGLVIRWRKA